jgi:hypothetical protein
MLFQAVFQKQGKTNFVRSSLPNAIHSGSISHAPDNPVSTSLIADLLDVIAKSFVGK